jgi:hypothetical protein
MEEKRTYWLWAGCDYGSGHRNGTFSGAYYTSEEAALTANPNVPFEPYELDTREFTKEEALRNGAIWE